MYNIVRGVRVALWLGMLLVLVGCIQPIGDVDQTKTAVVELYGPSTPTPLPTTQAQPVVNPTVPVVVNSPVAAVVPQGTAQVEQFLQRRGIFPAGLALWYDFPQRADYLKGFSFTDVANNPCAGFVVAALINGGWQATESGAIVCADQSAVDVIAAYTFVLTSDGQPHSIVFGRVQNPAVTAIRVQFDDANTQTSAVVGGGFLVVKEGVSGPTNISGLDAQQNVIIPYIPLLPAA